MGTAALDGKQTSRSDMLPSLIALSSHPDTTLSTPATHSIGHICGGKLMLTEAEGVLSSNVVKILCTRLESDYHEVDLIPNLLALDKVCSGLKKVISTHSRTCESDFSTIDEQQEQNETSSSPDHYSLARRCESELSRIHKAVVTFGQSLENDQNDENTRIVQDKVGGIVLRHFRSSIQSPSQNEIGESDHDVRSVWRRMEDALKQNEADKENIRREMEADKEKMKRDFEDRIKQMETEREQYELLNKKWIEEGLQKEEKEQEEKKREAERKREEEEEEERRKMKRDGAATIELFQQDKFDLIGNVFSIKGSGWKTLQTYSFGQHVVRITFIIRFVGDSYFFAGLMGTDLTEQAKTYSNVVGHLKGGAGWVLHSLHQSAYHDGKEDHYGKACVTVAVGQRVVMEADGREGKRTLKLSQDGETQPVFFSNIPVPFRFAIQMSSSKNKVEIVSTEVLKEASIDGGTEKVEME
ncbi:hypothetical protein BLNAU_18074 [Blattamonas nauphoetae]|uniref:Uncharacterized protein n=1 Tax=Blattamonas nauphoetae TaxID=2049346 RepID=A0ABQ9X5E7_9EUKA|nr:hypothetical protein BLNAU_18074 [Blattamonas nauphoetae]